LQKNRNRNRKQTKQKAKTVKLKAMKTRNNVQKTILSTAAVIMSLVMISFTVTAQEFWKTVITNSSFNQIALAMAETNADGKSKANISFIALYLQNEAEEQLTIESWMTDPGHFDHAARYIAEETENTLQVEDWMFDTERFENHEVTEAPMVIESWMTNEKTWSR
jgi:hypothetical protein